MAIMQDYKIIICFDVSVLYIIITTDNELVCKKRGVFFGINDQKNVFADGGTPSNRIAI